MSTFLLKWFEEENNCPNHSINFIFIKENKIQCALLIFSPEDFIKFKKSRKKVNILEESLIKKQSVFLGDISNYEKIDDFIKNHKLEKRIREYKIKYILKD